MEYASVLFDESPLVVSPQLAEKIGLNEAIVLQQLHYWLRKSPKIRDDRAWIYNSVNDWRAQFPFFGASTIRRALDKLVASGAVVKGDFNRESFDKTSWWSIDYAKLRSICGNDESICGNDNSIVSKRTNGLVQNEQIDYVKMSEPIPETTQRLTTETNDNFKKEKATAAKPTAFDRLIAEFTENEAVKEALRGFLKMRSATKKPMTDRALRLLLSKLEKMGASDEERIALLDQSIFNGWQDIYPLKGNASGGARNGEAERAQSPLERLNEFLRSEHE